MLLYPIFQLLLTVLPLSIYGNQLCYQHNFETLTRALKHQEFVHPDDKIQCLRIFHPIQEVSFLHQHQKVPQESVFPRRHRIKTFLCLHYISTFFQIPSHLSACHMHGAFYLEQKRVVFIFYHGQPLYLYTKSMAVAILLNVSNKRMYIVIILPTQPLQKEISNSRNHFLMHCKFFQQMDVI